MENKTLEEMARQERLEYFKKWRANNKDKVRATNKRYWEKRALRKVQQAQTTDNREGKDA